MQRRRLLALGALSAAALAVGGGAMALLRPGLHEGRLTGGGREVFRAVSLGLLDGALPAAPTEADAALRGLLDRIDALVGGLPPHAQAELSQLLAILASGAGRRGLADLPTPWPEASVSDIQKALQSMRISSLGLRQQAYQALHDIVGSAYFSDAGTWNVLGYPGPMKV
jgi:hypothetical protein